MSSTNGKVLEFFAKIPRLEADESNWVIYKDQFLFAAAAASLANHIDGTGVLPKPVTIPRGTEPLTASQQEALDDYATEMSRWQSDEAIIKQAIASTIADSLFLELRKKETAVGMWKAVKSSREKKTRMVTVNMRCNL